MKVLITGGAGFIGSNFVRYLLKKDKKAKVVVFDLLTYASNPETIKEFKKNKRFSFIRGDIRDAKKAGGAVKKADIIINFAAETHVDRSISGPSVFAETNIMGTANLLEAARKSKIKKFIQVSTDEVYGSIKKGKSKETDVLDPTSPYSSSKAAADLVALSYYKTFGMPVVITRSSNNYGPYQHPEKFIPLFITNAFENKVLPLYGPGKNVRNWIYVQDNCEAVYRVMLKGRPGGVYNIGGSSEYRNIDVAGRIVKLCGREPSLIKKVKDRAAHDLRYALSSEKVKKLGWKPRHSFNEGLSETVRWYFENAAWWKALKNKSFKAYYKKHYK